jgi:hypothetical protein
MRVKNLINLLLKLSLHPAQENYKCDHDFENVINLHENVLIICCWFLCSFHLTISRFILGTIKIQQED